MARFDVHKDRRATGYLLDCQSDLLSHLDTRLVVPLVPVAKTTPVAARLNPIFVIDRKPHVMATQYAAGIPLTRLGAVVQSLKAEDFTITNALDVLLTGI